MSVGQDTIALSGTLEFVSSRRNTQIALTQNMGELEVKGPLSLNIPANTTVNLPLSFSTGVGEALFLYIYAPKKLVVRVTGKDISLPGPMEKGLKGYWIETMAPGEGITAITLLNESLSDNVQIEYAYGALADVNDTPAYWLDANLT